jgi:hypothetical protein
MLAQYFKTPADLGIDDAELAALINVLGILERGEVRRSEWKQTLNRRPRVMKGFNMLSFYAKGSCGTVGCICGWAEYIGKLPTFSLARKRFYDPRLMQLFEPEIIDSDAVRPDQAAIALRNFLTLGDPRWAEAVAE